MTTNYLLSNYPVSAGFRGVLEERTRGRLEALSLRELRDLHGSASEGLRSGGAAARPPGRPG
jgi:hypothetical protein